ncbi:acyl-CoA N-acyltransferase [Infundibulicybe gibba]|nr:acyl-CoA N-acyltransferase [Infundibulicybe gibba]
MPPTHVVPTTNDQPIYTVTKDGSEQHAYILARRPGEVYVHYVETDKRLDEWIPEATCRALAPSKENDSVTGEATVPRKRKRKSDNASGSSTRPNSTPHSATPLSSELESAGANAKGEIVMTEEDFDIQHHKQITAQRNFDRVHFGDWQIKTWYFSPYPLTETETDEAPLSHNTNGTGSHGPGRIPGVNKATPRSHGRTSDLLAGGLGRTQLVEKAMLWVCEMCFKYMADGSSWELHRKNCLRRHPPGRKVYQRGAHTIWEVDGAREKLYCQNLSLFGKLFIDVKTLFFDCDNFLFYILTDATSKEDHIIGFFSKEKVSYDDYNLACIMTLPPYQRKGYGMLMIEFSYELSRRSGKVGTPERPLSDLGLRSYLAYWVSTLIRFFRRVLSALPPEVSKVTTFGTFPDLLQPLEGDVVITESLAPKKRKKAKGWDGEGDTDMSLGMAPLSTMDDPLFTTQRMLQTTHREDGGAETHVLVKCTLGDIARATNLRVEDAAFALNECGLLDAGVGKGEGEALVLTRKMVEKVAEERNVKRTCMDLSRVLL